MSELGDKRRKFSGMLARAILHAEHLGYQVAVDFVKRCEDCEVGHERSLHKLGLAADLNLYLSDEWGNAIYLDDGPDATFAHARLHDYWDLLGGAERISWDLNHYSIEHGGMR